MPLRRAPSCQGLVRSSTMKSLVMEGSRVRNAVPVMPRPSGKDSVIANLRLRISPASAPVEATTCSRSELGSLNAIVAELNFAPCTAASQTIVNSSARDFARTIASLVALRAATAGPAPPRDRNCRAHRRYSPTCARAARRFARSANPPCAWSPATRRRFGRCRSAAMPRLHRPVRRKRPDARPANARR